MDVYSKYLRTQTMGSFILLLEGGGEREREREAVNITQKR